MTAPAYQDLRADEIARPDAQPDGATIRVIAGDLFGVTGPGRTHTPISYAHVTLDAGAQASTDLPQGHVVLVYPLKGAVDVADGHVAEGIMAVVDGDRLTIGGVAPQSEVLVLTGRPIGEPVARYGPFVMNTEGEIRQAFADFEKGKFGRPSN